MTDIGTILNKLQQVKIQQDKSWMACCPAHPDKNPSLHISVKEDNILLHCLAGCSTDAIVATIGLNLGDLFIKPMSNTASPKIVATYDYKDEQGNELYQVVRYDPKSFKQRHKENSEWVWNMNGTRRVPYHLDGLQDVTFETVYLVEG